VQNSFQGRVALTPESNYLKMPRKKSEEKAEEKKEEKLEAQIEEENIEEELKEEKETKNKKSEKEDLGDSKTTLTPLEDYLKCGTYLGTKVITPGMRQFVYKRRNDGLAVLNTSLIDEKLKEAIDYISEFAPEDITVVCKREAGWKAVQLFSELTGIRAFTKKYPAGIITNTKLPTFFETDLMIVCDPWVDKNALSDANRLNIPVVGLCDANNLTAGISRIVPCNNKSNKSLALVFYILTREYCKKRKIKIKLPPIDEFAGEKIEEVKVKIDKKKEKKKAEEKKKDEKKIEQRLKPVKEGV